MTDSQFYWDRTLPLVIVWSNILLIASSGSARAVWSGLCPVRISVSPRTDTPQPLWVTCSCVTTLTVKVFCLFFFLFYVEEKFPVFLVNSLFKFSKFPVYPVCTHWLSSCYSSPLRVWISHLYSFCQVLLHMDKNSLSLLVSTLNSPISFSLSFICQMLQSLNYHCGPSLNLSHFVYVSLVLESPA